MNVPYLLQQWEAIKIDHLEKFDNEIRFYILKGANFETICGEFRNKQLEHSANVLSESEQKLDNPLELTYSGNILSIQGYTINRMVKLIRTQSEGSGLLIEPIFKLCKSRPTQWHKLTKKGLDTYIPYGDTELRSGIERVAENPQTLRKYFSRIGIKGPIRDFFVGKSNNDLGLKFRIAMPKLEWDKLPKDRKRKIVNNVLNKPH